MATCAIRPSLLNKFTFRPVYVPPPGDSHRIICRDPERNIMFSPEHNNGGAVIQSLNLGRTFQKQAASLASGGYIRWCLGAEGFMLDRGGAVAQRLALSDAGSVFSVAPGTGIGVATTPETLFFGNNNYFIKQVSGALHRRPIGGSTWTALYAVTFGVAYLRGLIYGFTAASPAGIRVTSGMADSVTPLAASDFPVDRVSDVVTQRLTVTGRNLDTLSVLSNQGTLFRSENSGENWVEGAPIGVPEYNGRWPRLFPGLGRFGEEVILTIADNGEAGALTVDRGETWRTFELPEFLRYVGNWSDVEIAYVDGRWLGAFGNYGIWELIPDYRG